MDKLLIENTKISKVIQEAEKKELVDLKKIFSYQQIKDFFAELNEMEYIIEISLFEKIYDKKKLKEIPKLKKKYKRMIKEKDGKVYVELE